MKPRVKKNCLRLVTILIVMFLVLPETAFAQDKAENVTDSAQFTTRENADTRMPQVNDANPGQEKKDADLLDELMQSESANKSDQTVKEDSCVSVTCTSDKSR